MWNAADGNDILDFALLWEPLGGPPAKNVATAFSIDLAEFNHRLRSAASSQLALLQHGTTSPEATYAQSALAPLLEFPRGRNSAVIEVPPHRPNIATDSTTATQRTEQE